MTKSFLLAGLLQNNYLPAQKKRKDELPPCFSSLSFTTAVAKSLIGSGTHPDRAGLGYDAVEYLGTKFNGVPRVFHIPHPAAYAALCICIHDNWSKLSSICNNPNSMVVPQRHRDGRVIIMDYDASAEKNRRALKSRFGCRFAVEADIAGCFPSIYSHAVPWAIVGPKLAKSKIKPTPWYDDLDRFTRTCKRKETQGVAIGPATSNILVETILHKVDEQLRLEFAFSRYIDDYTAYCATEDEARLFIVKLSDELRKYKLLLNARKTRIFPLPQPVEQAWKTELSLALRCPRSLSSTSVVTILDAALAIHRRNPDGSVLKYAVNTLASKKLNAKVAADLLDYVWDLSLYQPALLPALAGLIKKAHAGKSTILRKRLNSIALDNARFRRSDGMAWCVYYLNLYAHAATTELATEIVVSRDCLSLLLLYKGPNRGNRQLVVDFVATLDHADIHELDQYWLLLYEMFRDGAIINPYGNQDSAFTLMKQAGVQFFVGTKP